MPKTFQFQSTLPRLPVPPLQDTAARYLKSVKPLQTPEEHAKTAEIVKEFVSPSGLGPVLQQRLLEYEKTQPNSWLEKWWLELAYHSWRESSMVNSNWFMLLANHPDHPQELQDPSQQWKLQGQFSQFQLQRAARLIRLLLEYLEDLKAERVPPEMTKQGPQCMNQYKYLFGITRVPQENCDKIVGSFPPKHQHIIVLVRDQIYVLNVFEAGKMLNTSEILVQLERIVKEVKTSKNQPSIPVFTGEHRDQWTKNYQHLLQLGNKLNFDQIESALFACSLDDIVLPLTNDAFGQRTLGGINGHNRWFDTCLNMIVQNDGRASVNGEHSPLDALIPAFLFNTVVSREQPFVPEPVRTLLSKPRILEWKTNQETLDRLEKAKEFTSKLAANSDLRIVEFHGFGTDFIKKLKVSPDAFVQMSLQLTFWRLYKKLTPVYETASTRKYLHGRTETTRSCSVDSAAFVKAFDDPKIQSKQKFELLKAACKAHVDYVVAASDGQGCDRHLLGLSMMLNGQSSPFFKDPVYSQSKNFRLSTSNLFPGKYLVGTGFGCVVPDGYGMNYMIHPDHIRIGIESKKSCLETDSQVFSETLKAVWADLKGCFEEFTVQAKL